MVNYYEVLGASPSASETEIRVAYRRAAMQWHPDRNSGSKESEEKFKGINEAYRVLSHSVKRKQYDDYLGSGLLGSARFGPSVDVETAARIFMVEMYKLAAELTIQKMDWRDWRNIGSALIERGCPPTVANAVAFQVVAVRKAEVRTAVWRAFRGYNLLRALYYLVTGNAPQSRGTDYRG